MSDDETIKVEAMILTCLTCRGPIEFQKWPGSDEWVMVPHLYCDEPKARIVTHNPRKFGVITGTT